MGSIGCVGLINLSKVFTDFILIVVNIILCQLPYLIQIKVFFFSLLFQLHPIIGSHAEIKWSKARSAEENTN